MRMPGAIVLVIVTVRTYVPFAPVGLAAATAPSSAFKFDLIDASSKLILPIGT